MDLLPYIPRSICDIARDCIPSGRFVDGSFLFADVSGFTAMSEKLAVIGREGSEELTAILNAYFTRMVDIVTSLNGDIIVFGGDAMLIYFEKGEEALACAVEMQKAMGDFVKVETSVGGNALEMSMGMSSGRAFLCALGDENRAGFGMFGKAVNRVAAVESTAEAGQICLDAESVRTPGLDSGADEIGEGVFLLNKYETKEIPRNTEDESCDFDPRPFIHSGLLRRLEGGFASGEHRKVTVMFMNFTGVLPLLDGNEDDIIDGLNGFFVKCGDIVARYDGFVCKIDLDKKGYKMMIVFGAPHSHEDDPERAFLTALEISHLDCPFELKIGVNTGFVFAGFVGAPRRKEYTVMGDAVNIAARLMAAAPVGEIYVHQNPDGFELDTLEPIRVKGKSEPLEIHRLVSRKEDTGTVQAASLPLIGRKDELNGILEAASAAKNGSGGTLFVLGAAGTGKSRLLKEAGDRLGDKGFHVLRTECLSHTGLDKYYAWRRLLTPAIFPGGTGKEELEGFLDGLDPELMEWAPLAAEFFNIEYPENDKTRALDGETRKRIIFDLVHRTLAGLSAKNPMFLVIDSAQWLDDLSLKLCRFIGENIGNEKILTVLSGRNEPGEDGDAVELGPLPEESCRELAAEILKSDNISSDVADFLHDKSRGNPLFLIETLVGLREEGKIFYDEHFEEYHLDHEFSLSDTPDSLRGIIMARVDRLDEKSRRLLQTASVAGGSFDIHIIESMTGGDTVDIIDGLSQRDFLYSPEEGVLAFTQPLIQETVYDSISFSMKRRFHHSIGDWIEERYRDNIRPHLPVLAHHYYHGDNREKALEYLDRAGEYAQKSLNTFLVIDCYKKILEIAGEESRLRVSACLYLGNIYRRIGEFDKSLDYYEKGRAYGAAEREGEFLFRMGELFRAKEQLDRALDFFRSIEEGDEYYAHALSSLGLLEAMKGNLDGGLEHLEEAAGIFSGRKERKPLAYCLMNIGNVARHKGETEEALEYMKRVREIFIEESDLIGESQVLFNMGAIYIESKGMYGEALECYERALDIYEKIRDYLKMSTTLINAGMAYKGLGRYEKARSSLVRALKTAEKIDSRDNEALALLNLAAIESECGEVGTALDHLGRASRLTEETGNVIYGIFVYIRYIETYLELGALERAGEYLGRAKVLIEKHGIKRLEVFGSLHEGRLAALKKEWKRAERTLKETAELLGKTGQKTEEAEALMALAEIYKKMGDRNRAVEACEKAVEIAEETKKVPLAVECSLLQYGLGLKPMTRLSGENMFNKHIQWKYERERAFRLWGEGRESAALEQARRALRTVMTIAVTITDPELQKIFLDDDRRTELKRFIENKGKN